MSCLTNILTFSILHISWTANMFDLCQDNSNA
jgi:hypothetical protein